MESAQFVGPDGKPLTKEQLVQMRKHITAEAAKRNISVEQYLEAMKQFQMQQQQQQRQPHQQPQHAGHDHHDHEEEDGEDPARNPQLQKVDINPGAPSPEALAVAKWLRGQDLKSRTCILNGQRKDMFRVKRALRALQSPAYAKARAKNPLLPETGDAAAVENAFKMLPISLLALRVSKIDPHEGHGHAPAKKRVKGLWTVKIEQHQEVNEDLHFVWLYDGPQWRQKLYAAIALVLIMAVVMFPLWPIKLRIGVWYLSMGMLGLIGLFFAMAIFRLILFCLTVFTVPPGLWLYPNLFEDVGFFDSFRPLWGWQEEKKKKTKKKPSSKAAAAAAAGGATQETQPSSTLLEPSSSSAPVSAKSTAVATSSPTSAATARNLTARVEEVEDE